ncbi:MAG TPA: hybrid sensor histidine kinase/response regulator [Burkholderiales bacterium]|nr:hybrid sensor histidine kinase/response regulator [Burkholderiales bacterium]
MPAYGSNPRDLLILTEQVRAVYRTSYSVAAAHGLVAILLFVGLQKDGNRPLMLLWAVAMCLVVAAYIWWGREFQRSSPGPEQSPLWARRRMLLGLAAGVVWGFAGGALFPTADVTGQALLTLVLLGLGAGSLTASASYLPANFALVIPMFVPLILRYGWSGATQGVILAILLIIYLGFILNGTRTIHRVLEGSLRRRFENVDLIDALTVEKTAAEKARQEAESARQEAESANRAKSQFLAAASHDLRQPLHALGLFAAALDDRIRYPEVRSIVNNINASIAALEALFNELLDISKLDAGVITASRASFPLQALFDRVASEYGPVAALKGLRLRVMPTDRIICSDPMLIERILHNLVSNAIRYTPKGKILVGARWTEKHARLEVWDTGLGIPKDQHERIFEEFYQLANPERDRGKGLGLGLAIVRRLTGLLGHPLRLDSMVGKGSVFRVTVPLGEPGMPCGGTLSTVVDHEEHLSNKYVVFIDDERAVREGMETLLKQWGCQVTAAASLEECMRALGANEQKPDLFIADYRLREGAKGDDAIRKLQAVYGADIPGVLITGDTAPDRILEAQASGYYLLHKPVVPGRLRVFMNLVLRNDDLQGKGIDSEAAEVEGN